MAAYEDEIRPTSARNAPWYVVPADHKWFARLIVGGAILDALERLDSIIRRSKAQRSMSCEKFGQFLKRGRSYASEKTDAVALTVLPRERGARHLLLTRTDEPTPRHAGLCARRSGRRERLFVPALKQSGKD